MASVLFSKKHIPALIKSLGLNSRDGMYLETLIDYNQSKSSGEKELYHARLKDLAPEEPASAQEIESFKFLADPIHCFILDMTDLKDFSADPKWIQSRLQMKTTLLQIEGAITRLQTLGLIQAAGKNKFKKTHQFLSSSPDLKDAGAQKYHQNVSNLAAELIEKTDVNLREYNGYSLCIKESSLPRAKQLMREFTKKFLKEVEIAPNQGDETYQLNLQFFPITQPQPQPKLIAEGGNKNERRK